MSPHNMFLEALIWKKTGKGKLELPSRNPKAQGTLNQLFKRNDMPLKARKPRGKDVVIIERTQYKFSEEKHELARR